MLLFTRESPVMPTFLDPPVELRCTITMQLFVDPVITPDGQCYERTALAEWRRTKDTSPITRQELKGAVVYPCTTMRQRAQAWRAANNIITDEKLYEACRTADVATLQNAVYFDGQLSRPFNTTGLPHTSPLHVAVGRPVVSSTGDDVKAAVTTLLPFSTAEDISANLVWCCIQPPDAALLRVLLQHCQEHSVKVPAADVLEHAVLNMRGSQSEVLDAMDALLPEVMSKIGCTVNDLLTVYLRLPDNGKVAVMSRLVEIALQIGIIDKEKGLRDMRRCEQTPIYGIQSPAEAELWFGTLKCHVNSIGPAGVTPLMGCQTPDVAMDLLDRGAIPFVGDRARPTVVDRICGADRYHSGWNPVLRRIAQVWTLQTREAVREHHIIHSAVERLNAPLLAILLEIGADPYAVRERPSRGDVWDILMAALQKDAQFGPRGYRECLYVQEDLDDCHGRDVCGQMLDECWHVMLDHCEGNPPVKVWACANHQPVLMRALSRWHTKQRKTVADAVAKLDDRLTQITRDVQEWIAQQKQQPIEPRATPPTPPVAHNTRTRKRKR